jgi:hypothetical protein
MTNITDKKFKGSALAYGLVIMTMVMIILVSIIGYIVSQLKFSANRIEREKALQIAEAGIYHYRWYLAHATDGMDAQQLKAFWNSSSTLGVSGAYDVEYKDPETSVPIGKYTISLDAPEAFSTIATVTAKGETYRMPGVTRTVSVRFRRPSWSEYMYIVDGFLNIGAGADVYGRAHSNFGIHMDGVAHNAMTSYNPTFIDPDHTSTHNPEFGVHTHVGTRDPVAPPYDPLNPWPDGTVPNRSDIFMGGRQLPVPKIEFNGVSADLANMRNEVTNNGTNTTDHCTASGCYFNNSGSGRRLILKTNGDFDVCKVYRYDNYLDLNDSNATYAIDRYLTPSGTRCNTCSGACLATHTIPQNGIIFVEDNIWVEGTINDKIVTIAADNAADNADIYIGINNIAYTNHDGRDIIGMVAKRNIAIIRDCQTNLLVEGALIAQTGRRFRDSGDYASNKSSLTMNGALASFLQPYVNADGYGFTDRTYNFDNNLLYFPPPYFPTGTEYSIDLWEEL